jgi:hypothetical protein
MDPGEKPFAMPRIANPANAPPDRKANVPIRSPDAFDIDG